MTGDGKVDCQTSRLVIIAAALAATMLCCMIVSGLVLFIRKWIAKERYFRQNGGEILKHQRVKIFTDAELAKATNNYNASNKLGEGGFASVYKGRIDSGVLVAVKKPRHVPVKKPKDMNNEGSMSTHNEFQHEISIITLYHQIHDKRSMVLRSLKNRLRIATEAALTLEYLHSLADLPIIHRYVKTLNILLDENYSAKVFDFGASVLISLGKTHIAKRVQGTIGYLDPEYFCTDELTMKSDVYSFGFVLVELLTGETPIRRAKSGETINIVQYFIFAMENLTLVHIINIEASNEGEMREIKAVGLLARRCLNHNGVNRPTMREVAEQLARINKNLWPDQHSDEETQSLLDETRSDSLWTSISEINKLGSTYQSALDIEAATTSSSV